MAYYPNIADGSINPVGTIYGLFYTHDDYLANQGTDLEALKEQANRSDHLMYIVPIVPVTTYRAEWKYSLNDNNERVPTYQNGKSVKFDDKNAYSRK